MDDITHQAIRFNGTSPFLLRDVGGRAPQASVVADLYTPATTPPPWPGVVVCEGLGGVKVARERRYGRFLAGHGYAALVLDSFATRGYGNSLHPVRAVRVTETMMLADAFEGLRLLADRDDVDEKRIGIIGFSYGGMITLLAAYEQLAALFAPDGPRFCAHVSYYGPTVPRLEDYRTTGAPVAILNGDKDANVNETRLGLIAGDLENGGSPVENVLYEGIYHQWDSDDIELRFDRFNLKGLGTRVTPDNTILDERTGHTVRGFLSRTAMIARSVSLKGFHLKRDEETLQHSDALLLRTLKSGWPSRG